MAQTDALATLLNASLGLREVSTAHDAHLHCLPGTVVENPPIAVPFRPLHEMKGRRINRFIDGFPSQFDTVIYGVRRHDNVDWHRGGLCVTPFRSRLRQQLQLVRRRILNPICDFQRYVVYCIYDISSLYGLQVPAHVVTHGEQSGVYQFRCLDQSPRFLSSVLSSGFALLRH